MMENLLPPSGDEREWILREHLQRLVLYAMARSGLYAKYTLQGGTALRLVYGSPRLSLDLDFTFEGDINVAVKDSEEIRNQVERLLASENIKVRVSGSKLDVVGGFYRYFLVFDTQRLLGRKTRIKVEVLRRRYSSSYYELKTVGVSFPSLTVVGVRVKRLGCILADKVCSLAGGWHRGFIRWRDVFDIYWAREKGATLDKGYLFEEFGSYVERLDDLLGATNFIRGILEKKDYKRVVEELSRLLNPSLVDYVLVEKYLLVTLDVLGEAVEVLGNEAK
jgi:predicted nucleotidyltransferase component of viral defense system